MSIYASNFLPKSILRWIHHRYRTPTTEIHLWKILDGFAWVIGICIHLRSNISPNNVDVPNLTIHFQMSGINICSISPTLVFSIITKGSIC